MGHERGTGRGGKLDAEILTIGDELNRGEIVDTNSAWLAERLTTLGVHVRWRTSVTDDEPDMMEAVTQATQRARLVLCTGGLGPTEDDRTVDVMARLLGVDPVIDADHEARMRARFAERNFALTPNNLRQVRIPAGATVLANRNGLAPGFMVTVGESRLVAMPGVPREMKAMWEGLLPHVHALVGDRGRSAKRTWRLCGIGESHVDHALLGLLTNTEDATLHFRIAYPENLVTVVVRREDQVEADRVLERVDAEVRARLGSHLYGIDEESLAEVVGRRLLERSATLAVAESCTGGMLGERITSVPGSSAYFKGGVLSYADEIKRTLLGVEAATLAEHGAVSEPTVLQMAEGARRVLGATFALSISGIAGPSGGTPEKPVGTVFVAVAGPGIAEARKLFWPGEREQIRQLATSVALQLLYKVLTR